jgi:hypothetical protein
MQRVREEFDADRFDKRERAASAPDGEMRFPVVCGVCGDTVYASKEVAEKTTRTVRQGLDNPFVCDKCEQAEAEMENSGR